MSGKRFQQWMPRCRKQETIAGIHAQENSYMLRRCWLRTIGLTAFGWSPWLWSVQEKDLCLLHLDLRLQGYWYGPQDYIITEQILCKYGSLRWVDPDHGHVFMAHPDKVSIQKNILDGYNDWMEMRSIAISGRSGFVNV